MHINRIYPSLLIAAGLAVVVGTVVMYEVEKRGAELTNDNSP